MSSSPLSTTILATQHSAVTCMHITPSFIIVSMDNGELHILDHHGGKERVVKAMQKGVWCIDTWEDEWVIAGGVDGVLRVWELSDM